MKNLLHMMSQFSLAVFTFLMCLSVLALLISEFIIFDTHQLLEMCKFISFIKSWKFSHHCFQIFFLSLSHLFLKDFFFLCLSLCLMALRIGYILRLCSFCSILFPLWFSDLVLSFHLSSHAFILIYKYFLIWTDSNRERERHTDKIHLGIQSLTPTTARIRAQQNQDSDILYEALIWVAEIQIY